MRVANGERIARVDSENHLYTWTEFGKFTHYYRTVILQQTQVFYLQTVNKRAIGSMHIQKGLN